MNSQTRTVTRQKPSPGAAIFWGGLIAGVLDLAYAIGAGVMRDAKPIMIPQAVASGLLGMKSFHGGIETAFLGVGLHFLIAFTAAAVYYGASRELHVLVGSAAICGLVYGACVYLFMHLVVLPLSAAPAFRSTRESVVMEFIENMLLVGLPIALATRRYSSAGSTRASEPAT